MKNGKFLAGVIAGLGAGALAGLLFAPDKGSKTRKKLMKLCKKAEEEKVNLHDVIRKNKQKLQQSDSLNDLTGSVM